MSTADDVSRGPAGIPRWRRSDLLFALLLSAAFTAPVAGAGPVPFDTPLGTPGAEVAERLRGEGLRPLPRRDGSLVVEGMVLPEVYEVQRTLYEVGEGGSLRAIHVVVEPDPGAGGDEVLRLYEEVARALARRLGPPAWERAIGRPRSGAALAALAAGSVERTAGWDGDPQVRVGIPRRTDGRLVIAILVSRESLPRDLRAWGREDF